MNDAAQKPMEAAMRQAQAASTAGRHDEAEAAFRHLMAAAPHDARPAIGLVRALLARGEAAAAIDQIAAARHLPSKSPAEWDALLGSALGQLAENEAAEAAFRRALGTDPGHGAARSSLANLLRRLNRREGALAVLDATPDGAGGSILLRLQLLKEMWRLEDARRWHLHAVDQAATVPALGRLFGQAALLHGEYAPTAYRRVQMRLAALPKDSPGREVLEAQLWFGLGDAQRFLAVARPLLRSGYDGPLARQLGAACDALMGTASPTQRDRVFVVGLSRTATSSLHDALTRLGFVSAHWTNPISGRMLSVEDDAIFDAMSDIPIADAVEVLAARHPLARFVLSERPVEDWTASIERHYGRYHDAPSHVSLRSRLATEAEMPGGPAWRHLHERLYTQHDGFAQAYAAHQARVLRCFADAPHRLLRFNAFAGDGWAELCKFLGRPAPDGPFPHRNAG